MAHSRIWEKEDDYCYYERGQLENMIYSWQPNYTDHTVEDCQHALGIYSQRYFLGNRFGRKAFRATDDECSISLLRLRPINGTDKFSQYSKGKLYVHYDFVKKLWDDSDHIDRMMKIDNQLISAKIKEFERIPSVRYMWPLSFILDSNTVAKILKDNSVETDQLKELEK